MGYYLTKWPRLLVAGDPVTEDQAAEIIVRTTGWPVWANDRAWASTCNSEAGFEDEEHAPGGWFASFERNEAHAAELGVLDLEYLHNGWVASAWIGGPHGWVDWSGRVGCSTWNIGKHPEAEEVEAELAKIATAWPFLRMDVQLVADEGAGPLAAYWHVEAGTVAEQDVDGAARIRPLDDVTTSQIVSRLTSPYGERGCTLDQLRRGLELARSAAQAGGA